MRTVICFLATLMLFTASTDVLLAQGNWVQQPTALQSNPNTFVQVGGLWGVAMTDTGTGFAAGYASVSNGFSGVLRKQAGNPTWFVLPSSSFNGLAASHSLWSGVSAVGSNAWVCGSNGRLYRTTNNGNSWDSATNGIAATSTLFDIFFKSTTEGMVVGNNGAIYYTSDGGNNWVAQTLPAGVSSSVALYAIHSAGNNWFVAGENSTLLRGNPQVSATSWTDLSGSTPALGLIEALHFLDDQNGAIAGATTPGSGVYRTTNGGSSFSAAGSGLASGQTYNAVHFINSQYGWTGYGSQPLYVTTNGGGSWSSTTTIPLPSQTLNNWLTRIDFPSTGIGYASGGAPGTTSTGWILRYEAQPQPDISMTDTTMSFGTLDCDSTTIEQFTIRNDGLASLNISAITFNVPGFALVGPLPGPVPPQGGATISIRWTPTIPGPIPAGANMLISSNDPAFPTWSVALDGLYNKGTFAIGSSYQFPDACLGSSSEVIVTTTVAGNLKPLLINFEHVSGDKMFTLVSPPLGDTVRTGDQFTFRFTPTSGGSRSGVYRMTYGNPACPQTTMITLSGTAFDASLSLSDYVVDFGDICVDTFKDMQITVTNTGTSNSTISLRQFVTGTNRFPNQHSGPFGPIPPGQSMPYTVRFAPGSNDTGLIEAQYALILAPCTDTLLITLRGRGVRPAVSFIPTSVLAIGPTPSGVTIDEPVQIINSGNTPITIDAITLNPPHPRLTLINMPVLPMVLPQGQTTSVTVRFKPDRTENINASLCVHWTDPCADSSCLAVGATSGDAPTITVDTTHDVGVQRCDGEILDTLMVYNTGKGTLSLQRMSLTGVGASDFSIRAPALPATVNNGDSVAVILAYRAATNGVSNAKLVIEHNDPKPGYVTVVALTGERSVVELHIEGDTLSPFISCAGVGQHRSLRLRNGGGGNLTIEDISVVEGMEFRVASSPLPILLSGGQEVSFEITFTPSAKGVYTGKILVTVGPCNDTYLLTVTGEGNVIDATIAPSPLNFGGITIGSSDTRSLVVSNNGSSTLTLTGAWVTPAGPDFQILGPTTFPIDIAPGNAQNVLVEFSPSSVQTSNARVCVGVAAPCPDTLCADVNGRGTSTGVGVTRTAIEFRLDPCNMDEVCDTVSVINSGSQNVDITDVRIQPSTGFRMSLPGTLPLSLPANGSVRLDICALADFTGSRVSNLVIETTDPDNPVLRVPLTARRDSSGITLSEKSFDFGTIAACEIGKSTFLTVTNSGSVTALIDSVPGAEGFVVTTSLPVSVQPGNLTQLRVTFIPPRPGIYHDTLFLTTTRCGERVPFVLHGALYDTNYTVTPQPLIFSGVAVGANSIQNFSFRNLHLSSVRIADVSISPAGTDFASWGAYPKTVGENNLTDLPIQFRPTGAGSQSATACIILDQPCRDTICIPLQGNTADALLTADPVLLDFDSVAHCADVTREVRVRNNGGSVLKLTSSRIEGADAASFVIENPLSGAEDLAPASERSFTIRIPASAMPVDGAKQAVLVVESDNSAQPQLQVPLQLIRTTLVLPASQTLDFGTVVTGTMQSRQLVLRNSGTHPVHFSNVQLPAGVTALPTSLTLLPGDSATISVSFTQSAEGVYRDSLLYLHDGPCSGNTAIIIQADVVESLSGRPLDFGLLPNCMSTDRSLYIRNLQDKTATITVLTMTGPDAAAFSVLSPATLPVSIPAGDSLRVDLRLTPDAGINALYVAQLHIEQDDGGMTRMFDIDVRGDARAVQLESAGIVDFGDVSIQTISAPRQLLLRNSETYPVQVTAILPSNTFFSVESSLPALPALLQPGESITVTLRFAPEAEQLYTADLTMQFDLPCGSEQVTPLTGRGIDDWRSSTLRISAYEGRVDDIIDIPLELMTDVSGLGVEGWKGSVRFNPSMLYPMEVITDSTLSAGLQTSMQFDATAGTLSMTASGGSIGSGTGALVFMRFRVLIGDGLQTDLHIEDGFHFTGGLARVDTRSDGQFTLIDFCDAGGTRLVTAAVELRMQSSTPNPFTSQASLEYSVNAEGQLRLTLLDQNGRQVAVVFDRRQSAGTHIARIDGSSLAPGVYFAVLHGHGQTIVRKLLRMK
ncbi:choice-of-anchor D domain-containing protein [bacterium]|nr:choice-of-anchor D domain-containing protein [bacterium]